MSFARFALLSLTLVISSCSTMTRDLEAAPELLTAKGEVAVSPTDNENRKVVLSVKHLAQAEKVQPGAKLFVMWVQPVEPAGAPVQNLGAFNVSSDLDAKITGTTPHSKFDVFVTAENAREATAPTGRRLLWSKINY